MWSEETAKKLKAIDDAKKIDIEIVKRLAKTKTVPEIARELGESNGKVNWFCISNKIKTKSKKNKKSEVKEISPARQKQEKRNDVFSTLLRQICKQ